MQVRACKEPAAWLGKRASGATGEGDDRHREQRHEQPWSLKPHLRTADQTSKSCRKISLQYGVVEAADIASARLRPARQVSGISSPAPGNAKYGAFSYRPGRGPGHPSQGPPEPPGPSYRMANLCRIAGEHSPPSARYGLRCPQLPAGWLCVASAKPPRRPRASTLTPMP
jgi:hypothetical protein